MTEQGQLELTLPFPELAGDSPLLPARMVNEYQYCPRLAYLEWVQGEWADSADTVEGRAKHRRTDRPGGKLPPADELDEGEKLHARSLTLSSNRLGLIAKMDLIEVDEGNVTPVDYKRGKRPHTAKGAWDPERVQLCVQGLILREHGYACESGILYFVGSRERVQVDFDDELIGQTIDAVGGLRAIAEGGQTPPPLEDSPKCPRCSLVSICLPDEVNFLRREETQPRPLAVRRDEALPMYVQANGFRIGRKGETLQVKDRDSVVQTARLIDISQLVLMGNISVSTPVLHELMRREIPVSFHSYGGWFLGHTVGIGHKNVELRTAQYENSFDDRFCLHLARRLIESKIRNSRTLLMRNWREGERPEATLKELKEDARSAARADSLSTLLGVEGSAAARYFRCFEGMIQRDNDERAFTFRFENRNRRPPTDPVNALLSYSYALLTRAWTVAVTAVGFDGYRGFYHQPRYGRPALALDLMESFRPLVADSTVIQAINNGEVRPSDFVSVAGSVNLTTEGRKRFIGTFERRLATEVTHPLFGYRVSYRRLFEVQARLLARHLLGDIQDYPDFRTR